MVELIDPPAAETQDRTRKRGGGPQSESGRTRSRENSLGDSLFSKVVFSRAMALSILERNTLLSNQFPPKSPYEIMLVADMALAKAKLDRVAELQIANCDQGPLHIARFWDQDQQARARKLFARLPKNPDRFAHELACFKQGAELLIAQWEGLAAVAAAGVDWDEPQRRLAMDMLGVSLELRPGNKTTLPPTGETVRLVALAKREIFRLEAKLKTRLEDDDEFCRNEALDGLSPVLDPTTKRLDRYEAIFKRDYEKAENELARVKEGESGPRAIVPRARAWDVDPLIRRIKETEQPPPGECHSDGQAEDAPVVDSARATGPVDKEPAPESQPATVQPVAETTSEVPAATPASPADTPVVPAARPAPVAPESAAGTAPTEAPARSRRARKELQRRLHRAAQRQAGGKAQG